MAATAFASYPMTKYLKREMLYRQIWSRPIGFLARDFGVSSASLREACKIMAIPVPSVGYWAAARAGHAESPPPLPQYSGPVSVTLDGKIRETLVEGLIREDVPKPRLPRVTIAPPTAGPKAPRLIPVREWAATTFGEHAPHSNTLLRWIHDGRFQPRARKIGRIWWVTPDAEYMDD